MSQKPNDLGELDNMALRTKNYLGVKNSETLADKGYYKAEDLRKCVQEGITPYKEILKRLGEWTRPVLT